MEIGFYKKGFKKKKKFRIYAKGFGIETNVGNGLESESTLEM